MRTKSGILNDVMMKEEAGRQMLLLEVLIDIRDLLQKPLVPGATVHGDSIPQRDAQCCDNCATTESNSIERFEACDNPHCDCHQKPKDVLFDKAVEGIRKVLEPGDTITAKMVASRHGITYARASALIEQLEAEGIISAKEAGKPRRVL